jgi:hypothetical protein
MGHKWTQAKKSSPVKADAAAITLASLKVEPAVKKREVKKREVKTPPTQEVKKKKHVKAADRRR